MSKITMYCVKVKNYIELDDLYTSDQEVFTVCTDCKYNNEDDCPYSTKNYENYVEEECEYLTEEEEARKARWTILGTDLARDEEINKCQNM